MARIIYGGGVSSINGSIAGTTFQRNQYGSTVKKKPHQTNKNSKSQSGRKGALINQSQAWAALTPVQRTAWVTYAANYPQYSRLNPAAQLDGRSVFLKRNLSTPSDASMAIDAPTSNTQFVDAFTIYEINRVGGDLQITTDGQVLNADFHLQVYISAPVSETSYLSETSTRAIEAFTLAAGGALANQSIGTAYFAVFGILPTTLQYVNAQVVIINKFNGQVTAHTVQKVQVG